MFNAGDARSCVDIVIRSDNLFESLEEFRGQATTTTPGVSIDPSETTVEITDIDGMCVALLVVSITEIVETFNGMHPKHTNISKGKGCMHF